MSAAFCNALSCDAEDQSQSLHFKVVLKYTHQAFDTTIQRKESEILMGDWLTEQIERCVANDTSKL